MRDIVREIVVSLRAMFVIVVLGCVLYPVSVYALGQVLFHAKANGSLVDKAGNAATPDGAVGSKLLGQSFTSAEYFHPRPSAAGSGYDAANSSGTNLGPLSDKLLNGVVDDPKTKDTDESFAGIKQLVAAYRTENGLPDGALVPADAVTRSGSGLDPHISGRNAELQMARVAKARAMSEAELRTLVAEHTDGPDWGIFGDPGVNVMLLNIALDQKAPVSHAGVAAKAGE